MLLLIDNYDSFTYNLVQYLGQLGAEVLVKRNDALSVEDIAHLAPTHIVLSPGPCTPNESGICLDLIAQYAGSIPILGVCLGHQAIAQHFGGVITQAGEVMHGKTSMISHSGSGIFAGLPSPLRVGRYHSLIIAPDSLPDCLTMTAWTEANLSKKLEIMGISHKTYPLHGVQFHPESILSEFGLSLLKNFLENP